jgi:nucleotide-binding universal stress UspA family protein
MDIIIGVDQSATIDAAAPVVQTVRALQFTGARLELLHSVPLPVWTAYGMDPIIAPEVLIFNEGTARTDAEHLLETIATTYFPGDDTVRKTVTVGDATRQLIERADDSGAELIAVNASHDGPFVAALAGSVARSLIIGAHQSLLIARPNAEPDTKLRAVFATDHSPYAERCLQALVRMAPRGLGEVLVITAYPDSRLREATASLPPLAVDPADAVRHELCAKNGDVVAALKPLADDVDGVVIAGTPNESITQVLREFEADLLIIGARGHGLWERMTVGSVSLHQALTAPCSVLVLRV